MLRRNQQFILPATTFEGYYQMTCRLHKAFAGSLVIYALVALVVKRLVMTPQGGFVDFAADDYNLALLGAGLVSIGIGFVVLFVLPRWQRLNKRIKDRPSLLDLGNQLARAHLQRVQIAMLPAILGLVLFFCNGHLAHLVPFILSSGLLMVIIWPRWAAWQEMQTVFEMP